jgi:hypothetical protein
VVKDDGEEPPAAKPKDWAEMTQAERDAHIEKIADQRAEEKVKQFIKDTGKRDLGMPGGGLDIHNMPMDELREAAYADRGK